MTPQEYFGTIQQSFVEVWKNHLETSKYSDHKALNDYYDDIVDAVDDAIEQYQGIYGKLGDLKNTMSTKIDDPIGYLTDLKKFVKNGRKELISEDDTEIWSDIDEVLSIIDSTLYKLKELGESKHMSLRDYIVEAMEIYKGDHAIHELLLCIDNDQKMYKIVEPVVKDIADYLKSNKNVEVKELFNRFGDEIDGIIAKAPKNISFNTASAYKAKWYVFHSLLCDVDDEYGIHPNDWDVSDFDINKLKW